MRTGLAVALTLLAAVAASAQGDYANPRIDRSADAFKRATARVATQTADELLRGFAHPRRQIEEALLAQQLDSSATLIAEMIRIRRPIREVRDAVGVVAELAKREQPFAATGGWRVAYDSLYDLAGAVYADSPGPPGPGGPPPKPIIGRVSWRGTIDDRVHLIIRGRSIESRLISGAPRPEGISTFTSPLPNGNVEVEVNKLDGRGTVRVLQQPSRLNDFTAVIEIYDANSGSDGYRLDIVWR